MEPDIFMAFLRFLYISEISLTDAITLPVLYAARKYCVEDLVKICADSLRAKMTPETVCDILEQAHVYDIEDLRKMCLQFIFENGNSVLKSSGFSELCSVCVRQIVESNELFVDESDVYLALITWAEQECCRKNLEKDGANKRASLNDLFYNIRFPVMDKVFFTDVVSADTVLTETEKVSLFQHLFGSSPKKSLPFAETKREARMIKCFRFPKNEEGEIKCEPGFRNSNFSIDVRSSEDVKLQGLILFGACSTSLTSMIDSSTQSQTSIADQHLKITVSALPHQAEEVFTTELDSVEIPQQKTYSIFLKTPVMLKKGRVYALQVKLDLYLPYQTYSGMEGLKSVCSGSVKFEFMTHQSLIATTVEKGQIAGLLFSKAWKICDTVVYTCLYFPCCRSLCFLVLSVLFSATKSKIVVNEYVGTTYVYVDAIFPF